VADVVRGNPEQWPHIKKKIALEKILTFKNATEQRTLGTLTYKIKCKWENLVKKERLRLGGEQELDLRRIDTL
jgi:hypothetical protein